MGNQCPILKSKILYTPRPDKLHGYSQMPRRIIERKDNQQEQFYVTFRQLGNLNNCFNKPKEILRTEEVIPQKVKQFKKVANYLSGAINKTIEVINTQKAQSLEYRKYTTEIDISTSQDKRFKMRMINKHPIYSPVPQLLPQFKLDKERHRTIHAFKTPMCVSTRYQSLDVSLRESPERESFQEYQTIQPKIMNKVQPLQEDQRLSFYYRLNNKQLWAKSLENTTINTLQRSSKITEKDRNHSLYQKSETVRNSKLLMKISEQFKPQRSSVKNRNNTKSSMNNSFEF